MLGGYPIPSENYELHITKADCSLFYVVKGNDTSKNRLGMNKYEHWQIPRLAAEYLINCDGKTSHEDICSLLNVPFKLLVDQTANYLQTETGVISFKDQPLKSAPKLFVTGNFDSLAPLHMSLEVTDQCNLMCDHCYVSASPWKLEKRNYRDTIDLLDSLWNNGVKVVELTGGECTTHPNFKEILAHAAKTFHLVAVISNGYLLGSRDELADYVGSFNNVCVQISIHGKRDFHDAFTKKEGAFDMACKAVRRLKKHGTMIRIAMNVTPNNADHVQDVFLLSKDLGVDALGVAVITSFGRATNLGMCTAVDHKLQCSLNHALAPYTEDSLFDANRLQLKFMRERKQINCGAGWRSFGLNGVTGEVRSCLFLADSKKFGSVDRENYSDIFKSKYIEMFKNAHSPSPELQTCKSCHYIVECQGCFAKAFRVSEKEYPDCPWRQKYFPDMQL